MLKSNVVFVLGAGASIPYGYPSGSDLLDLIALNVPDVEQIIYKHVNIKAVSDQFRNMLKYAYPATIDTFIMQHKNNESFLNYGKSAIVRHILSAEIGRTVSRKNETHRFKGLAELCLPRNEDNPYESNKWLGYFFNNILIGADKKELMKNNIKVINFNYDRSFECFVHNHLKYTYRASNKEIYEFFKHIAYHHVYGTIAPIYKIGDDYYSDFNETVDVNKVEFVFNDGDQYQYGRIQNTTLDSYYKMPDRLNQIRVVDEERALRESFYADIMSQANYIVFLGFGYDLTNMNTINLKTVKKGCVISGTILGASRQAILNVIEYFTRLNKQINYHYLESAIDRSDSSSMFRDVDILEYLKYRFNAR